MIDYAVVPLLVLTELADEAQTWQAQCFDAEVELGHAENTIRQLRGDLAFADSAAATDKAGAVRIVDELVAERDALQRGNDEMVRQLHGDKGVWVKVHEYRALEIALREELAQERRHKAGWVDSSLFQKERAEELEAEVVYLSEQLASAEARVELYHDDRDLWQHDATKAEENLAEAYALCREKDALIATLQSELTSERGRLFQVGRIVEGSYDPTRMLLEIRRAIGIA